MVRPITDAYRAEWEARGRAPEDIPFMGVSRLIVVAETDDEAMSVARRAYRRWFESINLLWRKYDVPSPSTACCPRTSPTGTPPARASPARRPRRCEYIAAQEEEAGINYFCADLAFGDITFEEARARSSSSRARSSPPSTRSRRSSGAHSRAWRLLQGARPLGASPMRRVEAPGGARPSRAADVAGGRGLGHLDLALDALHARGCRRSPSTAASDVAHAARRAR